MSDVHAAPAPITESFATPDDFGDLRASQLHASLGERLGAQAGEAFMGGVRGLYRIGEYAQANSDSPRPDYSDAGRWGVEQDAFTGTVFKATTPPPEMPIDDAKARVKQEGLEGRFKLPDQPTIKQPVLDLMIAHAHERQQYEAAVTRGPQGFIPDALGFVTEIGAGMIDPVNAAAFSIPVIGEARYGQMLAAAGESIAARVGVRAVTGAAQGALGTTALTPADWWLHTRDGVDYTMSDALRSIVLGAGMGAAFHAGFGAIGDVRARLAGMPLPGSPEDLVLRALATGGRESPPPGARSGEGGEAIPAADLAAPPLDHVAHSQWRNEFTGQTPPNADPVATLAERIRTEAVAAGLPEDQAAEASTLLASRYSTRAQRLGVDPMTLLRQDGDILVRRGGEEGAAVAPEGSALAVVSPKGAAALSRLHAVAGIEGGGGTAVATPQIKSASDFAGAVAELKARLGKSKQREVPIGEDVVDAEVLPPRSFDQAAPADKGLFGEDFEAAPHARELTAQPEALQEGSSLRAVASEVKAFSDDAHALLGVARQHDGFAVPDGAAERKSLVNSLADARDLLDDHAQNDSVLFVGGQAVAPSGALIGRRRTAIAGAHNFAALAFATLAVCANAI